MVFLLKKLNFYWAYLLCSRHHTRSFSLNSCLTFSGINPTNVFLDHSLKAIEIKAKINKWDLIKLTSFHMAKETINKMKRQLTEWENCKQCDWQEISFQTIQTTHPTRPQKRKQPTRPYGTVHSLPASQIREHCLLWITSFDIPEFSLIVPS